MNVCYVFQEQYPWDIRVDKITRSLATNGISTHIVSRNRDCLPLHQELSDRLHVHRLPCHRISSINTLINMPAFFSPLWFAKIWNVAKNVRADLVIVRDLPLSPTALLVGQLLSLPVIMDMAEDYPEMIRDTWTYEGPGLADVFIRNPLVLKCMERAVLPLLDGVLVVSEDSGKRIQGLGVKQDNISVVGNTPRVDLDDRAFASVEQSIRDKSSHIVLYVGGLEESRGLEVVVRAVREAKESLPDILFVIVGEGTSKARLQSLSRALDVESNVLFLGWRVFAEIPAIIGAADLCIVPHYVTRHTNTTLPNKIFDYMLFKKPVLVTDSESLMHIVKEAKCGEVYHDVSHTELAVCMAGILSNDDLRMQYGASGYAAVCSRYNWNHDEKVLLHAIHRYGA